MARSKDFYSATLAPLGFELAMEFEGRVGGFARDGKPWFWIREGERLGRDPRRLHGRRQGDGRRVLRGRRSAAGGEDNGAPGLRTSTTRATTAAYVRDPDGNNVEAVCHNG